ncbi:MAG: ATP-dependent helicase, partial [Rhodospirillales bacterium]|nr:ATP-dependent helicase [Rhodospirillales bacterium]
NEPGSYVHRIGRTARAGAEGIAISFCDHDERAYLLDIEKIIRQSVPVEEDHPYHAVDIANDTSPAKHPQRKQKQPRNKNRGQGQAKGQGLNQNQPRNPNKKRRRRNSQRPKRAA